MANPIYQTKDKISRRVSASLFKTEKGILISLSVACNKLSLSPEELGTVISALEKARNQIFGLNMIVDSKTHSPIYPLKEEIAEHLSIRFD